MIPGSWLAQAAKIAVAVWGMPHCGHVHQYVIHAIPKSLGLPANTVSYAYPWDCKIFYDDHKLHYWWSVCDATVHEWGHLTGHHHSKNPNSPMYPLGHPIPECADYGIPFLHAHR